jgi:hypothetical protein
MLDPRFMREVKVGRESGRFLKKAAQKLLFACDLEASAAQTNKPSL